MHSIVFEGHILPGYDQDSVRKNLAVLFKTDDPTRLERLFSGSTITLKKNLSENDTRKYLKVLNKAGLVVRVEPPLADDELLKTLSDFPELAQKNDLAFNTVMQSFSNQPLDTSDLPTSASSTVAEETASPAKPRWLVLLLATAAALLVCAVIIFWPTNTSQKVDTPPSDNQQEQLEALFHAAAVGSDEEFSRALKQAPDEETRVALRELRALAVEELPQEEHSSQRSQDAD